MSLREPDPTPDVIEPDLLAECGQIARNETMLSATKSHVRTAVEALGGALWSLLDHPDDACARAYAVEVLERVGEITHVRH